MSKSIPARSVRPGPGSRLSLIGMFLGAVALLTGVSAGPAHAQGSLLDAVRPFPIEQFELGNGLRVIVSEDHSAPIVALNLWYRVGSAHEPAGQTGFAHFFEHLMFEETENLGAGEMDRLVSGAGGRMNGTTSTDRTAYHEILPAEQLELGFFLHRERMANLVISERGFELQRQIVREEKLQRIDGQPYAGAQVTLDTISSDYAPYRHPTIGSMVDLDAADLDQVRAFYNRFYAPNNATLVVVGDVTVEEVRSLAERYLGDIPRGEPSPALPPSPQIPRVDGERRTRVDDSLARVPILYVGYTVPGLDSPDALALDLLTTILTNGESSRLHQKLVRTDESAVAVAGGANLRKGPGFLFFGALPGPGRAVPDLEAGLLSVVGDVVSQGVSAAELESARNRLLAERVRNRLGVEGRANAIQVQDFYFGDATRINRDLAELQSVSAGDIQRVAARYFTPENRIVVIARPVAGGGLR